jgi:hypothetical protein
MYGMEMEVLWRKLEGGLETVTGLDVVRREGDWKVPKWCVVTHRCHSIDGMRWPEEVFANESLDDKCEDAVDFSHADVFGMTSLLRAL